MEGEKKGAADSKGKEDVVASAGMVLRLHGQKRDPFYLSSEAWTGVVGGLQGV